MSPIDRRRQIPRIVTKVFGLSSLRPGQRAVIDAVLAGTHTLAIMPTGAGKSLCYQVPAMLMPGMTVVVSPLIALMQDQFEKMTALGITSVQVNSAVPPDEIRRARAKIGRRTVEFVFTTPEQLASEELRALLARRQRRSAGDRRGALHHAVGPRLSTGVPGGAHRHARAGHTDRPRPDRDRPS